ncbi:ABC transporter ATP-binding protein [Cellulomonas sp. SLBN-39]|uniref:ABC transporter ATP-binding protein n=1 Tax=Cellulomonas sp. SLBN-39 TaxID=2768446 RepID=UPI00115033E1|nr:ABC transporter ATP-binding protein [Cellulomonas sp. SLBN-39]TQL03515.1 energy-coupling factor transport system ATP-binding protein [Cellulomonas sp. SLBN-39]
MTVELRDVRIRHEDRDAWTPDGVTATLHPGEVVLVLGPSGCGKSTLALALDGLVPHAVPAEMTGGVVVDGVPTTSTTVPRLAAHVAMVFQDPDAQVVTGTVLDEVCFGPENLLVPAEQVLARAEHALRTVGLWERRADAPDVLSGGGRQRLAVACALALGSPVLVLDEPTANLDPVGVEELYAALRAVVADGTRTVVLVEHDLDAAVDLVDRVLVLDASGRLVMDGPTRAVLADRASELVALGVWLPVATLAALRLRGAGVDLVPLPLTPAALTRALDACPTLPDPVPTSAAGPVPTAGGEADPDLAVQVRGLTVRRGGRAVLHDVDLDVPTGALAALVGVNGAGKTTLAQAVGGVVRPPRGTVRTAGLDPATTRSRTWVRHVGFVFQNPEHQLVRATVHDELAHGLRLQGVAAPEVEHRVGELLDRLGLAAARDVHPFLLSGGQKRRLSVGTALVTGARVLVLDEPTFGQDRARAAELLDLLDDLVAHGTTVVVVTHDLQLVADHATHVAVLHEGRVSAAGTAADVLAGSALDEAGLLAPPLARATRAVARHPAWHAVTRLRDVPDGGPDRPAASTSWAGSLTPAPVAR